VNEPVHFDLVVNGTRYDATISSSRLMTRKWHESVIVVRQKQCHT